MALKAKITNSSQVCSARRKPVSAKTLLSVEGMSLSENQDLSLSTYCFDQQDQGVLKMLPWLFRHVSQAWFRSELASCG